MQGTRDQCLVQEDPICCKATKPMRHNYWAHVQQVLKLTHPRDCAPQQEKPPRWEACTLQLQSSPAHNNWRKPTCSNKQPAQSKIKIKKKPQHLHFDPIAQRKTSLFQIWNLLWLVPNYEVTLSLKVFKLRGVFSLSEWVLVQLVQRDQDPFWNWSASVVYLPLLRHGSAYARIYF